jgi:phage terminase large subunit
MFQQTTATRKIFSLKKRLRVVAGGTSASKTISILMWLIQHSQNNEGVIISVISESFPHLKRGAMRDFLNIMQSHEYYKDSEWNRTDCIYTFPTGSRMEFFSADQPSKVRGPRRDILFINEANNIPWETYDQLSIRTRQVIWLDYNPTHEYWYYTDVAPHFDHDFLTLTYQDNEALDPAIVQEIESHKHNANWWKVYGLGQLGEVESRIYRDWAVIDEIPHEARLERRGLDFGYSNDPAALVDIYKYNGGIILDERFYQRGMSNRAIADYIKNAPESQTLVYADSSEPKSIDEISTYGINIIGANKGPGSINQGIAYIQDQRVSVTKRSVNLIKEYRNYLWTTDKDGKIINKAQDINNHLMDALRYGLETFVYSYGREAGIVTARGLDERPTSFIVNGDGEAEAYHIDPEAIARANNESKRSWQYR